MQTERHMGGGVIRRVSKQPHKTGNGGRIEAPIAKKYTVLGVEVDKRTREKYEARSWMINGKEYSLLGVQLWATSKEIAAAYPEDSKAAREVFAEVLNELAAYNPDGAEEAQRKLNNTALEITSERMIKPMQHKNFSGYLEDVQNIYKADRAEREKLQEKFDRAKAENEVAQKDHGMSEAGRIIAKADFLRAEEEYNNTLAALIQKHTKAVDAVRQEMAAHLSEFYRATPEKMDQSVMQFLNTGIATPSELLAIAEQHKRNPTMLRVIGQHAAGMLDKYDRHSAEFKQLALLDNKAQKLTGTNAGADEMRVFNGAAEFALRGISGRSNMTNAFDKQWATVFAEYQDKMRGVDMLAEES